MFVILPVLQRLQKQVFVLASAVVLSVRPELRPGWEPQAQFRERCG